MTNAIQQPTILTAQPNQDLFKQYKDWKTEQTGNDYWLASVTEKNNEAIEIFGQDETLLAMQEKADAEHQRCRLNNRQFFDFMQDKDINEANYHSQLIELAQAEMSASDSDGDSLLSTEEYAYSILSEEYESLKKAGLDPSTFSISNDILQASFDLLDITKDGNIDTTELALPYLYADMLDEYGCDGLIEFDSIQYVAQAMQDPSNAQTIQQDYQFYSEFNN